VLSKQTFSIRVRAFILFADGVASADADSSTLALVGNQMAITQVYAQRKVEVQTAS
jgi:hypothetical protein